MPRNRLIGIIIGVAVVIAAIVVPIVVLGSDDDGDFTLTILHNNDGESKLLSDPDNGFPGIARFVEQIKEEQDAAADSSDGVITLTSGDNFLASKELNVSLSGDIFYDAVALSGVYDAMALGNHDFDLGPEITAEFVTSFDPEIVFLSANLDVSNEPSLQALEDDGLLARSTVIRKGGRDIGVIGAVTQSLPSISSPRQAIVGEVLAAVQTEAQRLTDEGVEIIILVSHLQNVDEELDLIPSLSNVDVVIAGGGDDLLRNDGDSCFTEQDDQTRADGEEPEEPRFNEYPLRRRDSNNEQVLIVTAPGGYRCFGRLDVTFDSDGKATSSSGQSIGVSLTGSQNAGVLENVEMPLNGAVSGLAREVVGNSTVSLDGRKTSVRTKETNLGSLLADSFIWSSAQRAAGFGVEAPQVSVTNGGGIRNDSILAPGAITSADTFDIAPFGNTVVVMEVPRQTLKDVMETALSLLPDTGGGFAQIGGFRVVYDEGAQAREIDRDNNCAIGQAGSRVRGIWLNDGTPIVVDGAVVAGNDIILSTIDFLARGGNCYPLGDFDFTRMGLTYQQSLAEYITDGLNGQITADAYPESGSGRITQGSDSGDFTLTILHNNDGESKLLADEEDGFPGVARFVDRIKQEQDAAADSGNGVITLTSGDNFLASKELNVSLSGDIFYDALALSGVYDAMALGNHDFDLGPDTTARFVRSFDPSITFLSANLDVSNEPPLQELEDDGLLARSTVIRKNGRNIGVIGAVTQSLPSISSPRQAVVSEVMAAVQAEAQRLTDEGVEIIILVSHLQNVDEELDLIPSLSNVDVVIAGGGDDLLRNEGDSCFTEQEAQIREAGDEPNEPRFNEYPLVRTDSDNSEVLVVTAPGGYRCFGRLDITFDSDGVASAFSGQSIGVSLTGSQDAGVLENVETPLDSAVSDLASNTIGNSTVSLDGRRTSVRTKETNLGSLLADAFIWSSAQRAAGFGVEAPQVSVTNGGGIRNDSILAPGGISSADTFDIAPFGNNVVVMEVPRQTLKDVMETALSLLPDTGGGFAQIGGFRVVYDERAQAREIDRDNNCAVDNAGRRVRGLWLDDGTAIVLNGNLVEGDDIVLSTTDFLARGGNCYPLGDFDFTRMGLTYQQSLAEYIAEGLSGEITAEDYPESGSGRIAQ